MNKIKQLFRTLTYPWRKLQTEKLWNKYTSVRGIVISSPEEYKRYLNG